MRDRSCFISLFVGTMMSIVLWTAGSIRAAQATTRTTAPTTTQASNPSTHGVNLSSPRLALKSLAHALQAGDRSTVLQILAADTPQEQRMAEATADLSSALAQLRRAAIAKFGADASRVLGVDPNAEAAALANIDAGKERIEGDAATVSTADQEGEPLKLVRQGGHWRLPVSQLLKKIDATKVDASIADMNQKIRVFQEVTGEIEAGKYPAALDARDAINQRMLASPAPSAATRPATAAASQPSKRSH